MLVYLGKDELGNISGHVVSAAWDEMHHSCQAVNDYRDGIVFSIMISG
jgi:hypothetical protein